jgi:outer membrane protein
MIKKIFGAAVLMAFALPLFISGIAQEAQAQNLKIGYTDHEVIIMNMPDYRQVRQRLQNEFETSQRTLQEKFQDFQQRVERFESQQALLSAERRAERQRELMELQQQLQQEASQSEQQLGEREQELMSPLFERVQRAIDTVAARLDLDLVLRTQVGMQPVILYVNDRNVRDITMDVARELGLDVDADTAGR